LTPAGDKTFSELAKALYAIMRQFRRNREEIKTSKK
jgi:hypothetical protein